MSKILRYLRIPLRTSGRPDGAPGLAEADGCSAFACAARTLDHFVAVLEESTRFTARQLERLLARLGQLHYRAVGIGRRAGNRARAEQVARLDVAAVGGLVREHLRYGPVGVAEARARQAPG